MYENEVYKYKRAASSEALFVGVYDPNVPGSLSAVNNLVMDGNITCSKTWCSREHSRMQLRMEQLGMFCFFVSIKVPRLCLDVIATALINEGQVVTIDKTGSSWGEFRVSYYLHTNHKVDTDCNDDCILVDLAHYVEENMAEISMFLDKHIVSYVSSVHQKQFSFVRHIIGAPESALYAEDYHLYIKFHLDGVAYIEGLIWPKKVSLFNEYIAQKTDFDDRELSSYVDSVVAATTDPYYLMSNFLFSEAEVKELISTVREYQVKNLENAEVEMPSLFTIVKHPPEISSNFDVSQRMLNLLLGKLRALNSESRSALTTLDWLELVWRDAEAEISDDFKSLDITLDDSVFAFHLEDRLSALLGEYDPLTAVYHFALMCCKEDDEFNIVLKRLTVEDCYIVEFNPLILKAASCSIDVKPIRGMHFYEKLSTSENAVRNFHREVDPSLYFTHREKSIIEAISLFDPLKKKVVSSTIVEYVDTRIKRPLLFRRISDDRGAENHVNVVSGPDGLYVPLQSAITRHFSRLNGLSLLLCETVCWYDSIGTEASKPIFELYSDRMDSISDSKVQCITDDQKFLPEYILLSSGNVMKMRKSAKVLAHPSFKLMSLKYMYSKLLLFSPVHSEKDLDNDIGDLFDRRNELGEVIVIRNER